MKTTLAMAASLTAAVFASTAQAETANYTLDPTHTFVMYEVPHFGTSTNRGRFQAKQGSVQLDKARKTGKVEVEFDITSVNTGVTALDKHLQNKDFFDAEEYPGGKFVGEKFSFNGDKVAEVSGQLTLRGKTNPVTLKAINFNCYNNPMFKKEVCGGDFETTIKRSQWGLDWGLNYGFPDAIRLVVQVEGIKQ
jgi:polyisoprenoid-binding protein YceI